jgi:uncharacterized protein (TIGR02679 family)
MDEIRLHETFGRPGLKRLLDRMGARLARGRPLTGSVRLLDLTDAERDAIARLVGRRPAGRGTVSVDLDALDRAIRHAGIATDLHSAVTALVGPLAERAAERERRRATWDAVFGAAAGRASIPTAARWIEDLRRAGLLRRLARDDPEAGRRLLEHGLGLADRLPARQVTLAQMAADVAGDSHALDRGQPLGTIGVRLAAALGGAPFWEGAAAWREAWARVGVVCDELSAPVLALNLRPTDGNVTARALALHADAGEPYRVSIRQLLRDRLRFAPNTRVFVCENPTVVAAAADRLGSRCSPLVCTDGQPATAVTLLLGALANCDAKLLYHGDFDWSGVVIANALFRRKAVAPWRYREPDYRATTGGAELEGRPVEPQWDPALGDAMRADRRAVHEEQVLDALLGDLGA